MITLIASVAAAILIQRPADTTKVTRPTATITVPSRQADVVRVSRPGGPIVQWTAPTTKLDGSPMGGILNYEVRYGKIRGTWESYVPVDPEFTSVQLIGLQPGTYYVTVYTIGTDGQISPPSQELQYTVR